jgi:hypothetical protein
MFLATPLNAASVVALMATASSAFALNGSSTRKNAQHHQGIKRSYPSAFTRPQQHEHSLLHARTGVVQEEEVRIRTSARTSMLNDHVMEHEFEGCSVWLEFDEEDEHELKGCIEELSGQHGGEENGAHEFVPHCTLLYNIPIQSMLNKRDQSSHTYFKKEEQQEQLQKVSLDMLRECRKSFLDQDYFDQAKLPVVVQPQTLYSFAYPKWADDNQGFHASILMLLLCPHPDRKHLEQTHEANLWLHDLHGVAQHCFPSDERHLNNNKKKASIGSSSARSVMSPPPFQPHLSLLYAPLSHAPQLADYVTKAQAALKASKPPLKAVNSMIKFATSNYFAISPCKSTMLRRQEAEHTPSSIIQTHRLARRTRSPLRVHGGHQAAEKVVKEEATADTSICERLHSLSRSSKQFKPKYLSVWDTRGNISEWKRIARVELCPSS